MRKIGIVIASLCFVSSFAPAQDRSSWEAYGGYQYTYSDYGPIQDASNAIANAYTETVNVDHKFSMTGGNAEFQKNVKRRWAAVLDLGGMYTDQNVDLSRYFQLLGYIPSNTTQLLTFTPIVYTVTAGPQVDVWKRGQLRVFARVFGGASRSVLSMDSTTRQALNFLAPKFKTTTTDPAVIAGGGAQYPVPFMKHLFFRGTADFVHPFSSGSQQNYLRITVGIVINKFGKPY
jgi:hypothetical protein